MVLDRPGDACAQLRRAIAIAEAIIREFPLSPSLTNDIRGNTFAVTLMRSYYLLLGKAMIMVALHYAIVDNQGRKQSNSETAFPLEDLRALVEKILKSLIEDPIALPPPVAIPNVPLQLYQGFRFNCHFGSYHYAGAYMLFVPSDLPGLITGLVTIIKGKPKSRLLISGSRGFNLILNI